MTLHCTGGSGFGVVQAREGHREDQEHLNWSAGAPCSCLETRTTALRDVMKIERTIVARVVNVS